MIFHDLQLLLSAVNELTKVLRTRRCVNFFQIIEHIYSNDNFVLFILLVQRHLSGTVSIKRSDTTKQLPTTSVYKYWLEEKERNFLVKRLTGDKYSYHYCRTQRRCLGSFTKCILNYFHLEKKCSLHHPWKKSYQDSRRGWILISLVLRLILIHDINTWILIFMY